MANSRADEMVLAGSAPTPQPGSDPVEHIHRGTSFIVLVDGAIVIFILAQILGRAGLLSSPIGNGFLASVVFTGLIVYAGYRNRKPWAYWPSVVVLFLATLVFLANALVSLYMMLAGGFCPTFSLCSYSLGRPLVREGGRCSTGTLATVQATFEKAQWTPSTWKTVRCWQRVPHALLFWPSGLKC